MAGLGILFLHYAVNQVVRTNLASVRRQNPRATVVTMSAGAKLPHGYSLTATPEITRFHSQNPRRGSDWLVCSWFLQRRERCEKWWIIEWDTYCATSVRDYYQSVWDFPFVASSVRLRCREPEWAWFREAGNLPEQYRASAMGAVPFLYLLSDPALERICLTLLKQPFFAGNAELRFATVANWCGLPPCGYSPPGDQITWKTWDRLAERKTIFHPVKHDVRRKR